MLAEASLLSVERAPARTASLVAPSGLRIGHETWGEGRPLVLVHGSFSDQRSNWMYVQPLLAPHLRGVALARRGRGATAASAGHGLADEAADLVALLRHLGEPVDLLGHSYGALVALAAAAEVPGLVRRLVLYEAPWPRIVAGERMATLERLGGAGDWQGFALRFFAEVLSVPAADLAALQGTQDWANILADAPATLGDLRALAGYRFEPHDYRGLDLPVLLQTGSESPAGFYVTEALAAVLPAARIGVLPGQAHEGMTTAPRLYAEAVLAFLRA